jgi:hypothetical protein
LSYDYTIFAKYYESTRKSGSILAKPDETRFERIRIISKRVFIDSKKIGASLEPLGFCSPPLSLIHRNRQATDVCGDARSTSNAISNEIKRNVSFYHIPRIFFPFHKRRWLPFSSYVSANICHSYTEMFKRIERLHKRALRIIRTSRAYECRSGIAKARIDKKLTRGPRDETGTLAGRIYRFNLSW